MNAKTVNKDIRMNKRTHQNVGSITVIFIVHFHHPLSRLWNYFEKFFSLSCILRLVSCFELLLLAVIKSTILIEFPSCVNMPKFLRARVGQRYSKMYLQIQIRGYVTKTANVLILKFTRTKVWRYIYMKYIREIKKYLEIEI